MAQDQLSSFIDAVQANPAMLQRLEGTDTIESVISAAKEMGYDFSADDLVRRSAGVSAAELEGCCATSGTVKSGASLCEDC